MADTLEKIYDTTLTPSSFDSNNEATVITTDSSTRHVIQDIKVKQGDANLPITATLQDNGHDLVALTGNSSGKEIIGTSSSVKVKATTLPIVYADHVIGITDTLTSTKHFTVPTVGGTGLPPLADKSTAETQSIDTTGYSYINTDGIFRQYWYNVGTQGRHVFRTGAGIDTTPRFYVMASNGTTQDYGHEEAYKPMWFDGHRYAYKLDNASLKKIDINASTISETTISSTGHTAAHSSYAQVFGLKDKYVISWPVYNNAGGFPVVTDLTTNTSRAISTQAPSTTFVNANFPMYLLKTSSGATKIVYCISTTQMRVFDIDLVSTTYTSAIDYETITLNYTIAGTNAAYESKADIGTRIYYCTTTNELAFIDFETSTPTQGVVDGVTIPSGASDMPHDHDTWGAAYTPSSSTISGRTYDVSPSLSLRITGVTSA